MGIETSSMETLNKTKELIIITYQPLTKFIAKRFGLKVKKKKWKKKYFYILPLINNKLHIQYSKSGFRKEKNKNFYIINSYKSLISNVKKLSKNFFFINSASGFTSIIIEIILKFYNGKKISHQHGYSLGELDSYSKTIYELLKFDFFFSINKILLSIIFQIKNKLSNFFYVKPDLYFCGNQLTYDKILNEPKKKFKINSFDYNSFLLTKKKNKKKKNDIVFLDSAIENSFEFNLIGLTKNYFNKNLYWKSILSIFEKIEEENNGKKIIVAAHMRRNINDKPIDRKFIFDRTINLVKNCKLVICHNSLSIQWAILFKKPIILIYVENFKYLAIENTREIINLSKALNLKLIYIDKDFNINFNKFSLKNRIKVDTQKYDNFIKKYINFSKILKKPKDQFLSIMDKIDEIYN